MNLSAELSITIDPPEINDPDGNPDLDYIQLINLLELHLSNAANDLEEMLNPLLNKPDAGFGLAQAMGLTTVLSQQSGTSFMSGSYLALGVNGSFYAPLYDKDKLLQEFGNLTEEDDYPIGAAVQALQLTAGFPTKREKIRLHGTLGFIGVHSGETELLNGDISAGIEYRPFSPQSYGRNIVWLPLSGKMNIGFRYLEAGFTLDPGTMEKNVVIDPDGSGPLPDQDWDIILSPQLTAGLQSFSLYSPCSIHSQIIFFDTFLISLGGGILPAWSRSSITLKGDSDVGIAGPLSDLISEPAYVSLEGKTTPVNGAPVSFYFSGKFQMDIGSVYLSIPVAYQPGKSKSGGVRIHNLAAGFYIGVQR